MKKMNKSYLLTVLGVLGSPLFTTNANADLFKCVACTNKPANSSYTSSGNGTSNCSWKCNSGYTQKGNTCCSNAPANATLNANDCGWTCNSGYNKNGSMCCSGTLPENASYSSTSSCSSWSCKSGYDKVVVDGNSVCTKSACTATTSQFKVGTGADAKCCQRDIIYNMTKYSQTGSLYRENPLEKSTSNSQYSISLNYSNSSEYRPVTNWEITWTYGGQKYIGNITTNNIDKQLGFAYVCNDKILYRSITDNKYTEITGTKTK